MTKQTFTAVDPRGKIHKRSSERRTYTHTVVRFVPPVTEADKAKRVEDNLRSSANLWAYKNRQINGGFISQFGDTPFTQSLIAEAKEWMKQFPTNEAYMAAVRADAEARANKWQSETGDGYWFNEGWCGRLDLAQKLASGLKGHTMILPATNAARGED